MDIYFGNAADKIYLNGASVVKPVKSCLYVPAGGSGETIEDVLDITLFASSATDVNAAMALLERKVTAARLWATGRYGSPVFLGVQVFAAEGYYVSEIKDGWIEEIGGAVGGPAQRGKGSEIIRLHLVRFNYFEAINLVSLDLTNLNGTFAALTVNNHNDGAHNNFVTIAAASLLGGLPARCALLFYSDVDDEKSIRNVYVGNNALAVPGTFNGTLEAEAGTGGSDTVDANCSNGKYRALAFAGTTAALLEYWTLTGAQLACLRGNLMRAVARQQAAHAYTDLYFQWQVMVTATSTVVWSSDWQLGAVSETLQVLPDLRLPPYLLSFAALPNALKLCLYARRDTTGSHTFNLDFVQLFVTDGFRKWEGIYPAPFNWIIEDNGRAGCLETTAAAGGVLVTHNGVGSQILLYPGMDNKLTFLWDMNDATAAITRTGQLSVWYAPRVRCF